MTNQVIINLSNNTTVEFETKLLNTQKVLKELGYRNIFKRRLVLKSQGNITHIAKRHIVYIKFEMKDGKND